MHEIICPHCNKAFKIDEAGYADIIKQVRNADFDKQLHERLVLAEQDKLKAIELAEARLAGELQKSASVKDSEIQALKARLDAGEDQRKLAVSQALSAIEKERDSLASQLAQAQQEKEAAARLAEATQRAELQKSAASKDAEIQALKAQIDQLALNQKFALSEAVGTVQKERDELKSSLDRAALEKQLAEQSLKDRYETQIKDRDDAIERLRDMKARLSTKMVGETLSSTAKPSSTASAPPPSRAPISRKTTTQRAAAKATTSSATRTKPTPKSSPSCSR